MPHNNPGHPEVFIATAQTSWGDNTCSDIGHGAEDLTVVKAALTSMKRDVEHSREFILDKQPQPHTARLPDENVQ